MLYNIFSNIAGVRQYITAAFFAAFAICFVLLKIKLPFLPKDKGRAFAVNGEASKGKIRGVGLVMIAVFVLCSVFFMPVKAELLCYAALIFVEMLSGYFDDASDKPWSDYKKGFIDLVVCTLISVVFVCNNPTSFVIFNHSVSIHPVLFAVLSTILLWLGINVTNCADGVDGLCASLGIVSLLSITVLFFEEIGVQYSVFGFIMIGVLAAYLCFNTSPELATYGRCRLKAAWSYHCYNDFKIRASFCLYFAFGSASCGWNCRPYQDFLEALFQNRGAQKCANSHS